MDADYGQVADRFGRLRARVDELGGPDVRIVAVTKGHGPDAIAAAVGAGARDIGENYAAEFIGKWAAVLDAPSADLSGVTRHFLGSVQRNKLPGLVGLVDVWQSLDRPKLASALAKRSPGAKVMVQVNISGEPQKGGCDPADAESLVAVAIEHGLSVVGLMGVGPLGDPDDARPGFRRLVQMADALGLAERSIGMSADLEVALSEGSTMVRVGTALFGPRPARQP